MTTFTTTTSQAYPWRETSQRAIDDFDDDTAPGGPAWLQSRRSDAELSAQYGKLKDSGLPLDTMKLVNNEDLHALNEDAGQILTLNERLGRYALYVSNLERSNKELGMNMENLMSELAALRAEFNEAKAGWGKERGELMAKMGAVEMELADAGLKMEAMKIEAQEMQNKVDEGAAAAEMAAAEAKTLQGACDEFRDLLQEAGGDDYVIPKHLSSGALGAAGKRAGFASIHGGADFERLLDAAIANSDAARIALRVSMLMSKGLQPPVDMAVLLEMLVECLSAEEVSHSRARLRPSLRPSLNPLTKCSAHLGPTHIDIQSLPPSRPSFPLLLRQLRILQATVNQIAIDALASHMRGGSAAATEDELLVQCKDALPPEEYEEVVSRMTHEKMAALARKGRQVPVDEAKLQELLESVLTENELAQLRAAEYEASYNAARAAMRMEKLLEKLVPLSDELVIACQRGEAWSTAELDRLVQANLSNEEVADLLKTEEQILKIIFSSEGGGGGGYGSSSGAGGGGADGGDGAGGGGGGFAGAGAAKGAGRAGDGMVDRRRADLEYQSLLLDLQSRLEADYLGRLAEANAKLRASLQSDLDKELQARREAQARNLALIDAVENQRTRNAELMAKLAEHEARELERLRQLESMQNNRELELESFRLQAERAIQDAAEARAAREQLERAINQYEKILDAIGVNRVGGGLAIPQVAAFDPNAGRGDGDGGGPGDGDGDGEGEGDGEGAGDGAGAGAGGALSLAPAVPPHLLQLEKFVLLTDEGAVAVRARLNGTVGYLKRQIHTQLHISPRLALTISSNSSYTTIPLQDDAIIAPFADGRGSDRLLLSAAPRPLSDFFPGSASHTAFHQFRVRPMVRGVPQNFSVVLRNASEKTTVADVQDILAANNTLLPMVQGVAPEAINLYFSPVFITPDVLLGRKSKQLLKPNSTLGQAQCIDDDIIYLSVD